MNVQGCFCEQDQVKNICIIPNICQHQILAFGITIILFVIFPQALDRVIVERRRAAHPNKRKSIADSANGCTHSNEIIRMRGTLQVPGNDIEICSRQFNIGHIKGKKLTAGSTTGQRYRKYQ